MSAVPVTPPADAGPTETRRAVLIGAAVALAVTLPAVWIVRALGPDEDSPLWVVPVVALLAGHVLGGAVAARRLPARPVVAAALAGVVAFVVSFAVNGGRRALGDGGVGLTFVVTALVYLQIAVAASVVGGVLGGRAARRRTVAP